MTSRKERFRSLFMAAAIVSGSSIAVGCGDDDGDVMGGGNKDSGTTTPLDGGGTPGLDGSVNTPDAASDGAVVAPPPPPPTSCPALASRTEEIVPANITTSTTWSCQKLYVLNTNVFVKGGATLTIEPGTVIQGSSEGALFITRDGKIDAAGTKDQPIVFTSYQPEGSRKRADWKGVVLLGKSALNTPTKDTIFEGLPDNPDYRFGAQNGVADETHNCGRIKYTRIEYAGFKISTDKELNGLSVGGCGSQTELDYIQVHGSSDDGVEFFGGVANAKHLVLTGNDDDNVDWDLGYRGKIQFVAIQQHKVASSTQAENGFEADNDATNFTNAPIANPTLYNVSMIGANEMGLSRGMLLRRGTKATIKNIVMQGFSVAAIDVRDAATVAGTTTNELTVESSIFFEIGADKKTFFPAETGMKDNDSGFDENAYFTAAARNNRVDVDPKLVAPYNLTAPNFAPAAGSPALSGGATPPSDGFFDATATFVGAIGTTDWTQGWTSYPEIK
jgi:hypothetical protein